MVKRRIPRRKESNILQEHNKRNWMGLFPEPKKRTGQQATEAKSKPQEQSKLLRFFGSILETKYL